MFTRHQLNEKAWYRALKVLFFLAFALIFFLGATVVYLWTSSKTTYYLPIKEGEFIASIANENKEAILNSFSGEPEYPSVFYDKEPEDRKVKIDFVSNYPDLYNSVNESIEYRLFKYENFVRLAKIVHYEDSLYGYKAKQSIINRFNHGFSGTRNPVTFSNYHISKRILYHLSYLLVVVCIFWLISRSFFYIFAKEKFLRIK